MKVIHFLHGRANPNGTNGGDRVIYNLTKWTAELGAQVFVFGLSEKSALAIGRASVQNFRPPHDPFSIPSRLKNTLCEIRPDIVHFHGVYTPRNARLARWLRGHNIPYAISPHGGLMQEVLSRNRIRKVTYLTLLGRTFCQRASLIHCISDAEADAVRPFGKDVPTVVAAHGLEGIDVSSLDGSALCRKYPQLSGKRIFGFLGRLDPGHKGLDLLVEACARVRTSLSNAVVVLAGPDWKNRTPALRRRVSELRLQDVVHFVGPKFGQDKFDFLASCDVFIHPSRWEAGVPFSVLDALEVSKPCMVSRGNFFGEFFQKHDAGIQVFPTTEDVAAGLRYMAEADAEQLQAMGARGRQAVLREFSWERTAQTLLLGYERARSRRRTKTSEGISRERTSGSTHIENSFRAY